MVTPNKQSSGANAANQGPAKPASPPAFLMPVMNGFMKAMLRSPLHGGFSKNLMLLSFQGRKSGKRYTIPVGYHRAGNTITVFTRSTWWKNVQGGAPVTLHLQGRDVQGRADVVVEPQAVAAGAQQYMAQHGVRALQMIGFQLEGDHTPSLDELARAAPGKAMIRIALNK